MRARAPGFSRWVHATSAPDTDSASQPLQTELRSRAPCPYDVGTKSTQRSVPENSLSAASACGLLRSCLPSAAQPASPGAEWLVIACTRSTPSIAPTRLSRASTSAASKPRAPVAGRRCTAHIPIRRPRPRRRPGLRRRPRLVYLGHSSRVRRVSTSVRLSCRRGDGFCWLRGAMLPTRCLRRAKCRTYCRSCVASQAWRCTPPPGQL